MVSWLSGRVGAGLSRPRGGSGPYSVEAGLRRAVRISSLQVGLRRAGCVSSREMGLVRAECRCELVVGLRRVLLWLFSLDTPGL